ncbi:hypothetical protein [Bacteroides acidifaciens]|uniref:hypothetical protein n=1 Tax=Bacteroides acidifaciens TaxID=85831 RepID=UPI002714BD12|nr:hypothetical protein [Bacteroides acidifaciens]
MSRSRKRTPVTTNAGRSQKQSKQQCNRRFRRIVHQRIGADYNIPNHVREVRDVWSMQGDGKYRWTPDMEQYEKMMRKK